MTEEERFAERPTRPREEEGLGGCETRARKIF